MTTAVEKFEEFNKFGSILGLERVNELLRRLGSPHRGMKYIHVAGTNGKGSTCKFLEKGLAGCGYKVGLYTSPYIEKFNERIQCDGEMITDEELEKYGDLALAKAAEMVADGLDSPTEFEVVMATAFLYFKDRNPDIVVLECGMGGIGDATNVIEAPMASVFTSVAFDHMHILGNTLAEIATDKAGIIKSGCPVISNVTDHDAAAVIARRAYDMGSRLYDVSKIKCTVDWVSPEGQQTSMELWGTDYSEVVTKMIGRHQAENLKTALATIEVLRKSGQIKIERGALYSGLKEAVQPVRFEVFAPEENTAGNTSTYVVLDGAHNDAGAEAIAQTMEAVFPDKKVLIVAGMVEKKETDKVLEHFAKIGTDFIATQPDYEGRAMAVSDFRQHIEYVADKTGKKLNVLAAAGSPAEAVEAANRIAEQYDVILYTGSLYLAGAIRSVLLKKTDYDSDRTLKYGNSTPKGSDGI
ncbi:MAG: bifunctional folylpolyglutamate synthase/dihydrofolate synthase [Clostridia bacterium]|nr:bifunctional folylpolyglutamate synthase/dihydrofolate synthase [Clostridia bacterium]